MALGIGVLIAGFVQLGFQLPFLRLEGRMPMPRFRLRNSEDQSGIEGVRKVYRLMLPAIFGVSVAQFNLLINTILASFLVTGSVSWLYYSDRLMEFPLGIFGIALATAILPTLSTQYASGSSAEFSRTLDWALRLACLVSAPASVALAVLAEPLMIVLFQYGEFSPRDAEMAGRSLVAFAVGLLALVWVKVLAPGFYARQNTKTPVKAGVIAVGVNIVFSLLLIWSLGHAGLAYAMSIAAFVNAGLLYRYLLVDRVYRPERGWATYLLRVLIAATAMGLVLGFFVEDSKHRIEAWVLRRVGVLTQWLLLGGAIYFCSLYAMGIRFHQFLRRPVNE